jgi:hypothetical protein
MQTRLLPVYKRTKEEKDLFLMKIFQTRKKKEEDYDFR